MSYRTLAWIFGTLYESTSNFYNYVYGTFDNMLASYYEQKEHMEKYDKVMQQLKQTPTGFKLKHEEDDRLVASTYF